MEGQYIEVVQECDTEEEEEENEDRETNQADTAAIDRRIDVIIRTGILDLDAYNLKKWGRIIKYVGCLMSCGCMISLLVFMMYLFWHKED